MRRGAPGEVLRSGCEPRAGEFGLGADSGDTPGGAIGSLAPISRRPAGVRLRSGTAGDIRVRPLGGTGGGYGAEYVGDGPAQAGSIPLGFESDEQRARGVRVARALVCDVRRRPAGAGGAFYAAAGIVRSGHADDGVEPDLHAR